MVKEGAVLTLATKDMCLLANDSDSVMSSCKGVPEVGVSVSQLLSMIRD